ncbi:hypothetical protein Bbelb_265990 [Branchiostoma belcheri]|nr:hypothetical protein Bbelb_265990 [Branchiostoma belcheri]
MTFHLCDLGHKIDVISQNQNRCEDEGQVESKVGWCSAVIAECLECLKQTGVDGRFGHDWLLVGWWSGLGRDVGLQPTLVGWCSGEGSERVTGASANLGRLVFGEGSERVTGASANLGRLVFGGRSIGKHCDICYLRYEDLTITEFNYRITAEETIPTLIGLDSCTDGAVSKDVCQR